MSFCIICYNIFMFGRRIRELRTEKNLTQKSLAVILECNQSMITRWEREECEPTETVIKRAAIFFNVSADYLLGLEDDFGNKTYTTTHNDFRNNSGTINTGTINNTYHTGK